jgi:cell division protein ZapA
MSTAAADKRPVQVVILNQPYTLLTKGDPNEVQILADSVNELMQSIAAKSTSADSTRVAVLACLHLADKLRSLEQDLATLKARISKKTEEFTGLLEQAIEPKR